MMVVQMRIRSIYLSYAGVGLKVAEARVMYGNESGTVIFSDG
jgi:hypothetical protein